MPIKRVRQQASLNAWDPGSNLNAIIPHRHIEPHIGTRLGPSNLGPRGVVISSAMTAVNRHERLYYILLLADRSVRSIPPLASLAQVQVK